MQESSLLGSNDINGRRGREAKRICGINEIVQIDVTECVEKE